MKTQSIRGMRDILPVEQKYWQFCQDQFIHIANRSGFRRLDLPLVENIDLFKRGIGASTDIVEKEMFVIKSNDGSEDDMALRPELTAGCVRAYIENGFRTKPQPVNFYLLGTAYRRERPQKNRYREFRQLDLEIIGSEAPEYDAQIIEISRRYLESLGFNNLVIDLNSIGCNHCRPNYRAKLIKHLTSFKNDLCADCQRRLEHNPLRVLDCKNPSCQKAVDNAPKSVDHLCNACSDHFQSVQNQLKLFAVDYAINPKLVRGLDYYNRTVFEIGLKGDSSRQSSLGGGGRFDYLAKLIGDKEIPAVGVALGLDRIINGLIENEIIVPENPTVQLSLISINGCEKETMTIYNDLILNGIYSRFLAQQLSLSNQLNLAAKAGSALALIVGPDEVINEKYILKDLLSGDQQTLSFDDLLLKLANAKIV